MTLYSEVVDSPKSAEEFLKLNKIKQKDILCLIVVWREDEN